MRSCKPTAIPPMGFETAISCSLRNGLVAPYFGLWSWAWWRRCPGPLLLECVVDGPTGITAATPRWTALRRPLVFGVLAYFGPPDASNGHAEAIKGRLEHLRGSALDFQRHTNYTTPHPPRQWRIPPRLHSRWECTPNCPSTCPLIA